MTRLYKKTERFVVNYFSKRGYDRHIKHLKRTVYWVKKLKPNADEALQIAAVAHDMGHARRHRTMHIEIKEKGFVNKSLLKRHQKESSEIIGDFLKEQGADPKLIKRVKNLVIKHEEGGTRDQNLLKDADSISFFENNIKHFFNDVEKFGKPKVRQKIEWMYNRISSRKAKRIAKKWYEKAMREL